jgi:glycosyltransferase involved in cell wall biosynthesis
MENPKVSVCVVTYNHVNYIRQCLDSLVKQETNFKIEILVSDDCSQDGTKDLLIEYEKSYPNLIKIFLHPKNLGAQKNFIFLHEQATGKYVAHIDGDDYSLSGKLQSQFDYLEQNPNCNIVWHRMYTLDTYNQFHEDNYVQNGVVYKKIDIVDLIANVTVGLNSSKMYRREFEYRDWIDYIDLDFSFNVLKLINSNTYAAFTADSIYGVYRSNIGISITHNYQIKIRIYQWLLRFYKDNLVDKSLINAKIFWLLLSDIKHLKKTIFYGLYAFLATFSNFRLKSLKKIYNKRLELLNRFKIVDFIG